MPAPRQPAYTRLQVDERRRRLLELGEELFTAHPYDDLSMARIAKAAGISKALLYHYFPSKQAFFFATLEQAAAELASKVAPDPALPPARQLDTSLAAYLDWIEEHRDAYTALIRSLGSIPDVREMVEGVREASAQTILSGLHPAPAPPALRAAVRAWLRFLDGVLADWIEHDDLSKAEVHRLLRASLAGVVAAAGHPDAARALEAGSP